jgi:hypothetical protein
MAMERSARIVDRAQRSPCAAFIQGFSLHAGVAIEAEDRAALERLIRYATRPPFAEDCLSRPPDGRVVVELKRP